jgi:hypothetical protein
VSNEWKRSEGGLLVPRRRLLQGASAAAVSLLLPRHANAQAAALWELLETVPWLKIGKFVAATGISWGIGKVLDHFWDSPSSSKSDDIKKDISNQPHVITTVSGISGGVESRFGVRMNTTTLVEAKGRNEVNYRQIPAGLITAMDNIQLDVRITLKKEERAAASPGEAFRCWGAPTNRPLVGCPVSNLPQGGTLVGLWWGQDAWGRRRFVVIRTTPTSAGYIPCLGDVAEHAYKVVSEGRLDLAGPRLGTLIQTPAAHAYLPSDDAPSQA